MPEYNSEPARSRVEQSGLLWLKAMNQTKQRQTFILSKNKNYLGISQKDKVPRLWLEKYLQSHEAQGMTQLI